MKRYIVLLVCLFSVAGLFSQGIGSNSPKNSFNQLAPSVSDLIRIKSEQEKKKKKTELNTVQDRLKIVSKESVLELEEFIITNSAVIESIPTTEENQVVLLFCPVPQKKKKNSDQALLLLVDGQCVGVGSVYKGFYSSFPLDTLNEGFHTLSLITLKNETLFTSMVNFALKGTFTFIRNKKGDIELAN